MKFFVFLCLVLSANAFGAVRTERFACRPYGGAVGKLADGMKMNPRVRFSPSAMAWGEPEVDFWFRKHLRPVGFGVDLQPGECGWLARAFRDGEPDSLRVISPATAVLNTEIVGSQVATRIDVRPFTMEWLASDRIWIFEASYDGTTYWIRVDGRQRFDSITPPTRP